MSEEFIRRLKELPVHPEEAWQGGFVRLPGWVTEEGRKPFRPVAAFWASVETGLVHASDPCKPGDENFSMALKALAEFAANRLLAGYCPGRLQVSDSALAEHLAGELADVGIVVTCEKRLTAVEKFIEEAAQALHGQDLPPGALCARGVTLDRMLRFADAAKVFFEAAPWNELGAEDLIRIENPRCPLDMRFAVVLGASKEVYGLGFYRSESRYWEACVADGPEAYLALRRGGLWSLTYEDISALPLGDADLWEDYKLPVAGDKAYPCAICCRAPGGPKRPDAKKLSFLEGVLRALSLSKAEEFDSGSWTREVETSDGPTAYTFSLPFVLDPPGHQELYRRGVPPDRRALERGMAELHRFLDDKSVEDLDALNEMISREFVGRSINEVRYEPRNALEKAQELCYQAFDAFGRRKLILARKALEACPDCADAYVILAENARDDQAALELYCKGVEAGRRALGEKAFQEEAGSFWEAFEPRPFMRALLGMAQCQEELGHYGEAACNYQELLRLNPDDNQGVRYLLLPLLIELRRDVDARSLFDEYENDRDAIFLYLGALLAYRAQGDSAESRRLLKKARRANRHVPRYLLGKAETLPVPDSYSPGTEEEAIICASECARAWKSTPGALEWLAQQPKR